jgi:alpha-galactosidase
MAELCPESWLFNFTNPMTAICRAARKVTDIKIVGLCHGIFGTRRFLADYLGVPINDFQVQAAGINHFTWIYDMRHKGEDAYPRLRKKYAEVGPKTQPVSFQLFEIYGLYPSPGDRHVAEFLPFYHRQEADGGAKYGLQLRNVDAMAKSKDDYWARLSAQAEGSQPLSGYGSGEEVKGIITALLEDRNSIHVVNIPNRGAIPSLPDAGLVELTAMVGADGMRSICVDELPQGITNMLQTRMMQQELTVDAALTGDKNLALQALLADPMTRSVEEAKNLIDELLEAHAENLPQFAL